MGGLLSFMCISGKIGAWVSTPSSNHLTYKKPDMYRNINDGQVDIYDFQFPFGGQLKEDNHQV